MGMDQDWVLEYFPLCEPQDIKSLTWRFVYFPATSLEDGLIKMANRCAKYRNHYRLRNVQTGEVIPGEALS